MIRELAIFISYTGVAALLFLVFQIAKPPKKYNHPQLNWLEEENKRTGVKKIIEEDLA
jgi:hypothetical protein